MVIFPFDLWFHGRLLFALDLFRARLYSRLLSVNFALISSLTIHWALGAFFMLSFASFVTFSRTFLRPGLLYFLRNPQDPDSHPVRRWLNVASLIKCIVYSFLSLFIVFWFIQVSFWLLKLLPSLWSRRLYSPEFQVPWTFNWNSNWFVCSIYCWDPCCQPFRPWNSFKSAYIYLQNWFIVNFLFLLTSWVVDGAGRRILPKGGSWVAVRLRPPIFEKSGWRRFGHVLLPGWYC